ncbi:fibronectin type III domain-containing protein [Silvanigrella aquatica]|uniref:Uncharacterized protein n=1 Tax=Silvanigrella aquatica TaxID=1915309 RepID=A0A1L4D2V5_9BACT|nr:fibronectin type III domain-containing protein [Silvanigrella aquatica]APJ04522.1 hypothetical protein AXG55_11625 [Silvanigrella aquatica]
MLLIIKMLKKYLFIIFLNILIISCNFNPFSGLPPYTVGGGDFSIKAGLAENNGVNIIWGISDQSDSYSVIYGTSRGNYNNKAINCTSITVNKCEISNLINDVTYFIRVVATNKFGSIKSLNELTVTASPLKITSSQEGAVRISWNNIGCGLGNTNYTLQYGTSPTELTNSISNLRESYLLKELNNGTTYYFQIIAVNPAGNESSEVISVPIYNPPSAPIWSALPTVNSSGITLNWNASVGSGNIKYFLIRSLKSIYDSSYDLDVDFAIVEECFDISELSCTDNAVNLVPANLYYYLLIAENEGGFSLLSTEQSATTFPAIPNSLKLKSVASSSNLLSWNSLYGNADITFNIYSSVLTPVQIIAGNKIGSSSSTNILPNLNYLDSSVFLENQLYYYSVTATDISGTSLSSTEQSIPSALLTAPSSLSASSVLSNSLSLNWILSVGNAPLNFKVYRSLTGTSDSWEEPIDLDSSLSYFDSSLLENTNYYYKVGAINARANAAEQISSVFNTVTALKTAPTLNNPINTTYNSINFQWNSLPNNGTVTYNLYRSTTGLPNSWGAYIYTTTSELNYLDNIGLLENTNYYYMLTANNNAIGATALSSNIVSVTTGINTIPTFNAATNVTSSAITLNWNSLPNNGSVIYNLYRSTSGNLGTWGDPIYSGPLVSYTDNNNEKGLSENTNYFYYIAASNNLSGKSDVNSAILQVTSALQTIPSFISSATNVTSSSVTLNWNAAPNNGTVTYKLYRSLTGLLGSWGNAINVTTSALTYTDNVGLIENNNYYYMLTETNSSPSALALSSDVFPITTDLLTVPSFILPITNITNNSATISWNAAINNGIVNYYLYRSNTGIAESWSGPINTLTTATTFGDSGLIENTIYYYMISASNNSSKSKTIDSLSASMTTALLTAPTLYASAVSTNSVTLQWNASNGNGAVNYNIYRSTSLPVGTSSGAICSNVIINSCTDNSVIPSEVYYYLITATNAVNTVTESSPFIVTTLPNNPTVLNAVASDGTVVLTWPQSSGAGSPSLITYLVQRSRSLVGGYQNVSGCDNISNSSLTCTDIVPVVDGNPYYYKVTALTAGNISSTPSPVTAVVPITKISSISVISAVSSITLSWSGAVGASSFAVYSSLSAAGSSPSNGGTNTGCTSSPCVFSASLGQIYYYTIVANNSGVNSSASTTSNEYSAEVHVTPIKTVKAQTNQVYLEWTSVANATNYTIYYSSTPGTAISGGVIGCNANLVLSCTVAGLTNGQTYYFAIVITKSVGGIYNGTEELAVPLGNFDIISLSSTNLTTASINWSSSLGATSYDISYGTSSGVYTITLPTVSSSVTLPYSFSGLTAGNLYYVMVIAKNAYGSVIANSEKQLLMRAGIPTGLSISSVTSTAASLLWNVLNGNPNVTYNIYRSTINSSPFVANPSTAVCNILSTNSPNNVCNDSLITENTNYYYVITSSNLVGESSRSSTVSTTTALATAPSFSTTTNITPTSMTLNWNSAPNNGTVIYRLYRSSSSSSGPWIGPINVPSSALTFSDLGLTENTNYYYKVTALNNAPNAIALDSSVLSISTALSTIPTFIEPATNVTSNSITLNWNSAPHNGSMIYSLYRSTSGTTGPWEGPINVPSSSKTFTDTNLFENQIYYYRVSARNSLSGASDIFSAATEVTTAIITIPKFISSASNITANSLKLNWNILPNNGKVTYILYRSLTGILGSFGSPIFEKDSVTSYLDLNVSENTNYYYQLTVINEAPNSSPIYSSIFQVTTDIATSPGSISVTNVTSSSLNISWSSVPSNGLVTYNLYRSTTGADDSWGTAINKNKSTSFYSDSSLSENTNYYYMVSATNNSGVTNFKSSSYLVTTAISTLPTFITSATSVSATSVQLSWNKLPNNGKVTYNLYRSTSGSNGTWGSSIIVPSSATAFLDTGLNENTIYYYSLTAINNAPGASAIYSAVYSITTDLQSIPTFNSATNISANSLTLNWNSYSNNGNVTYKLYRSTTGDDDSWGAPINKLFTATTYTDNGLNENTIYYYMVTASNSSTTSTPKNSLPQSNTTALTNSTNLTNISISTTTASFKWNSVLGNASVNYSLYRSLSLPVSTSGGAICSNISIKNCTDNTMVSSTLYYYVVTASNSQNTVTSKPINVTTLPLAPTAPIASAVDASVSLTWASSVGSGIAATTTYLVQRSRTIGSGYQDVNGCTNVSDVSRSCVDIVPTVDGAPYYYKVTAMTSGGNSLTDSPATAVTPIVPITFVSTTTSSTNINLTWSGAAGGTTFKVYSSISAGGSVPALGTLTPCSSSPCNFVVGTLGQTIYYTIIALNSGINASAFTQSAEVSATPLNSFSPKVTAQNSQISLNWNSIANATDYKIYYSTTSGQAINGNVIGCDAFLATSCVISGLTNGQTYYFALSVTRSIGGTLISSEESGIPIGSFSITNIVANSNSANVIWSLSAGASNYDVTYGTLSGTYIKTVNVISTGAATQSTSIISLTAGTNYYFMVRAKNTNGIVNANAEYSIITTPVAPENFSILGVGSDFAILQWDNNLINLGITYDVYRSTKSGFNITDNDVVFACSYYVTSSTPFQLSCNDNASPNLIENTKYYYKIIAVTDAVGNNESVSSSASNQISVTTKFNPTDNYSLSVSNLTDTSLTLSWKFNVGSDFISYSVYQSDSPLATSTGTVINCSPAISPSLPSVTNICNVSGLNANQKYYFAVKASNNAPASSNSISSSDLSIITNFPSNGSLIISQSNNTTGTSVTLRWALNIGFANVNYSIYQSGTLITPSCSSPSPLTSISPSTTVTCSITGLTENTSYDFKVVATNGNDTITSNILTVITIPVTAPTGLTASISSVTAIGLNWDAYSKGSAAFSYYVYASTNPVFADSNAFLFCNNISITSCSNTQVSGINLSVGTIYYFILVVKNASGKSIASNYLPAISISFSPPINSIAPTLNGVGLSSSGIITTSGNVLTANQGSWSNATSCVNQWNINNALISNTSTTYTTQSSDLCRVVSYCVSCQNLLGTTTSCSSGTASSNGINITNILSSYASRVQTVSGNTLTAAGQTQIQGFLNNLITNNVPFPDVIYAMRNHQNAGTGTTLFELFCDSHNATLSSSTFTWDSKGILGDSTKSTVAPYYGIAVSPTIFSTSLPSTQIAVSKTPILNPTATQNGVFGYTMVSGSATGYGLGYGASNSILDQISGNYNLSYADAFQGKFNFVGRSLNGSMVDIKINSLTNSYANSNLGGGAFVIGNYTYASPNSSSQINGYIPFAAAYSSRALPLAQMETLRQAYNSSLGQAMPFNLYIASFSSNSYRLCPVDVISGACSFNPASTGSGFNGPHHIIFNKGFAYIVNYFSVNASVCRVSVVDGSLSNCTNIAIDLDRALGIGLSIYGGYAYYGRTNSTKNTTNVIVCNVSDSTGALSGCTDSGDKEFISPVGSAAYNNYLYVANNGGSTIRYCSINSTNGKLISCNNTGELLIKPRGISFFNNYAYISNLGNSNGNGYIVYCKVNLANGTLTDCATTGVGIAFRNPDQMTFNKEGVVYIDDFGYESVIQCNVNSNGTLTDCKLPTPGYGIFGLRGVGIY